MSQWFSRVHFLWEEEVAPAGEVPRTGREAATGVPGPLRRATRFALIGAVSISVMAQIVGVRLVAPVDADTKYSQQCIMSCKSALQNCQSGCTGATAKSCKATCQTHYDQCTNHCGS